jgi:hypothetical protein
MEVEAVDEGTLGKIWCRGHRGREGERRHRRAAGRRRGCAAASTGSAPRRQNRRLKARRREPVRGRSERFGKGAGAAAPPASRRRLRPGIPKAPRWSTTVREALRDAMAEEMRRDEDVFLMGEEVAEYQGAYKITQGLLQEFGAARHRHADHRAWLRRRRRRRGLGGPQAHCRVHDLQLRHAGDRPDHQLGRQDALHVRRADGLRRSCSAAQWRRSPRGRPAQPGLCCWYAIFRA